MLLWGGGRGQALLSGGRKWVLGEQEISQQGCPWSTRARSGCSQPQASSINVPSDQQPQSRALWGISEKVY